MEDQLFAYLGKYMTLTDDEKATILEMNIFRTLPKGHVLLGCQRAHGAVHFMIMGACPVYDLVVSTIKL